MKKKSPDELTLYTGGVRHADVFVNGVCEFAMKDTFASRVLEECDHLVNGLPVDEDW
jgi:hypothetical protein